MANENSDNGRKRLRTPGSDSEGTMTTKGPVQPEKKKIKPFAEDFSTESGIAAGPAVEAEPADINKCIIEEDSTAENHPTVEDEATEGESAVKDVSADAAKSAVEDQPADSDESADFGHNSLTQYAKSDLREHMGIGAEHPPRTTVRFFVEVGPSRAGARCQHPACTHRIEQGMYRIAVCPGMNNYYGSPDYYHVGCLESLVDFSESVYLDALKPVTRNTWKERGLKASSVADGNFLVDGGAERLVLEWTVAMENLIKRRDGLQSEPLEAEFNDLLHKSGSASFQPKCPADFGMFEFLNLAGDLAPIESDGPEDKDEWNLFIQYLGADCDHVQDKSDINDLGQMLSLWWKDKFLATAHEDRLSEYGKEAKEKLNKKAIRAIERLASIPMPDFQSIFFGRF